MIFNKISNNFVFKILKHIKHGHLKLTNFNNDVFYFGDEKENLKAEIKINQPGFFLNVIKNGSIGLAESYMKGEFETNNLSNLIELTARNIDVIYKFSGILDLSAINYLRSKFIKNTISRSKENIAKHYDLGNEFFSLWLDKTLTYSSAIFDKEDQKLEEAQQNKYEKLTNLLSPKSGSRLLEIGCGWGGFAEHLGKKYDVKLDCITISKKQYEFAKERIHKSGLNHKVNIEMIDYRDVKKKYDAIASIEMIEAVGKDYLYNYFQSIKNNLAENGKAGIQAITINDKYFDRYKTKQDFIQKYIFPGGFLPSKKVLYNYANKNGLEINSYNSYGLHYSNTLILWRDEFLKKWDLISKQGFDLIFKRMWDFYLSYCEAGFKSKNIDLIQFSLSNK
ncbi:MAG: class I SAM-dependent methyltransferase [Pelagibacterales bacterium]|nr:class I SAM-dependent methyltransferase [Pelagibacterales bacterium]